MTSSYQNIFYGRIALVFCSAICLRMRFCWSGVLLHVGQALISDHTNPHGSFQDWSVGIKHRIREKIMNIFVCWSIAMVTDFQQTTYLQTLLIVGPCVCHILVDLSIIREFLERTTIDHLKRNWDIDVYQYGRKSLVRTLLYLLGTTALYIGQCQGSATYGYSGVICLWLVLGFDWITQGSKQTSVPSTKKREVATEVELYTPTDLWFKELDPCPFIDSKVDRVYTIGCFDVFHHGHVILLQRMRAIGKQVIVGVHTDQSIEKLKKLTPRDDTETRMMNVKKHADFVFCVASTDPSAYLEAMFKTGSAESALFVRGDDMKTFPGRHLCESLMAVQFLPYTEGVSSTLLRGEMESFR